MDIRGIKIDNRTYDFDTKIAEVKADLTNSNAELNTKINNVELNVTTEIEKVSNDLSTVRRDLESGKTYNINISGNASTATSATTALKIRTSAPSNPVDGDIWIG